MQLFYPFLCWFLLTPVFSYTQNPNAACTADYTHESFYGNNVLADISNSGNLFYDGSSSQFLLPFVNQDALISTIYSNGLWIGGFDDESNLRIAAAIYGLGSNNVDYWPGPLDETEGITEQANCNAWNRIWSIRRFEIEYHLSDFFDNGQIDHPLPSLLEWPGHGNPHFEGIFGFELPDSPAGLAPFFDQNNDGTYDPLKGDYPLPEGLKRMPEQTMWCVYNDEGGGAVHRETNGAAIRAEIHLTVWAFTCEDDAAMNNTIFTSHKIINRSASVLDSFHVSLFNDGGIGCSRDDYAGCNPDLNTHFFYNADVQDGSIGCIAYYEENPPVQTVTMLNHDMDYFRVLFFDCPFYPSFDMEFYALMTGSWLTYGGSSCNPNLAPTNFAFPGDPNDPNAWSMLSENIPHNEVQTLASVNFGTIQPGGFVKLDMAYSYHRGEGLNNLENVTLAFQEVAHIRDLYENHFENNCFQEVCSDDCVWAGDANKDGIANYLDLQSIALANGQIGPDRPGPYIWSPRNGDPWVANLPNSNVDLKHSDCDGNGTVTSKDFELTTMHYNSTTPEFDEPSDIYLEGPELFITPTGNNNFNELISGQSFFARLNLTNVPALFALSFQIEYDSRYFDEFDPIGNGFGDADPMKFTSDQFLVNQLVETDFSIARKHLDSIIHSGVLFAPRVKVKTTFDDLLPSDKTYVRIKNITAIRSDGTALYLGATTLEVTILDVPVNSVSEREASDFTVFPNPSSGMINIQSQAAIDELSIYTPDGKRVFVESGKPFLEKSFDVDDLNSGLYFIKCKIDGEVLGKKLFINREYGF